MGHRRDARLAGGDMLLCMPEVPQILTHRPSKVDLSMSYISPYGATMHIHQLTTLRFPPA